MLFRQVLHQVDVLQLHQSSTKMKRLCRAAQHVIVFDLQLLAVQDLRWPEDATCGLLVPSI